MNNSTKNLRFTMTPAGREVTVNGITYRVLARSYQAGAKYERYRVTSYTAYDVATRTTVAHGLSFSSMKNRLARYIEDRFAGCVRNPYQYGVSSTHEDNGGRQ